MLRLMLLQFLCICILQTSKILHNVLNTNVFTSRIILNNYYFLRTRNFRQPTLRGLNMDNVFYFILTINLNIRVAKDINAGDSCS